MQNEGKDSYDAIDLESSEEDDRFNKGGDETSEQEDPPITKKLVIELLVCILAFVGRVSRKKLPFIQIMIKLVRLINWLKVKC